MTLTWVHLPIAGIGLDIAGAVVLALSFSAKKPHQIRLEVPRTVVATNTPGRISAAFPQALARSMARQRAEARLGLALLVLGFLMQALYYFVPPPASNLASWGERLIAVVLILIAWSAAYVGMKTYVPWDETRTWNSVERQEERVERTAREIVARRFQR